VTLGENLGKIVQVTDGLAATDRLINNPPAGPLEGKEVQLASARLESP
jgi:membrane fusion protein, multidrug efflux system